MHTLLASPWKIGSVIAALAIASWGDSTGIPAAQSQPTASDTVVIQATAPLHPNTGRLVEELAIGEFNGPLEYSFGSVYSVAVGRDGSIYVADENTPAVRQYDAQGKYIRTFGSVGAGPGEYGSGVSQMNGRTRGPQGVAVFADGRVVVHSYVGRRLNFYGPRGEPVVTKNEPGLYYLGLETASNAPMLVVTDTIVHVRLEENKGALLPGPVTRYPPQSYGRFNRSGVRLDTIVEPGVPFEPPHVWWGTRQRNGRQVPFTHNFTWTLSPHGYFVTGSTIDRGGRYSFELRTPTRPTPRGALPRWKAGDPVRSIRVPYQPVPVRPEEARDFRAQLTASFSDLQRGWSWNGPDIPKFKPPYKRLWVDEQGRIWVRLSAPAPGDPKVDRSGRGEWGRFWAQRYWRESVVFDVLRPNGEYIGRVTSNEQIHLQAARDDLVWAIDDTDFERLTVRRYRIDWTK